MSEFSKAVMADVHAKGEGFITLSDEDLKRVLLTSDGRGATAKAKALEILLERERDKGYSDGWDNGADNERSREI